MTRDPRPKLAAVLALGLGAALPASPASAQDEAAKCRDLMGLHVFVLDMARTCGRVPSDEITAVGELCPSRLNRGQLQAATRLGHRKASILRANFKGKGCGEFRRKFGSALQG